MAEINGVSVPFVPIVGNNTAVRNSRDPVKASFDSIFQQELEKVKFSNHALKRLESRNIQLGEEDLTKIQNAVEKAESKGARDSLILMDLSSNERKAAFIVNIPNRTVVTAIEVENAEENVFTNIDSVVFA
ncbi:TIGR02530 family flagellar biosynthesis protein [Melioribacter sp. Ez-97]|jgi:flagellar operon protein|uniref:TIGR02530 family flagellar biosynthesis protein n=1 Tax=unclassified Melioribacter TaxID=2627329 RepID=UPI003BDD0173